MKRLYKILFISLFVFSGACTDKFLDEVNPTKFTSESYFTKDSDVEQAVTGLYAYLEGFYGSNGNSYMGCFDMLRGDEVTLPKNFYNNALVTWLTLNYNAESSQVRDAWRYPYQTIYRANWIIDNVTDNPAISDGVKNKALAQAYFMRGYCYFNLTRLFNEVPLVLSQSNLSNYYPVKASEEECWAQIFSDFEKALETGLPAPTSNFLDDFINTGVANAMMARAYLFRTRPGSTQYWDKVKQYADAVEKLNIYDLEPIGNFGSIYVYTKGDKWVKNKEMIWAAPNVYGPIYGGIPFMYKSASNLGTGTFMPVGTCAILVHNDTGDPYLPGNARTGRAFYALSTGLSNIMIAYDGLGDKRTREFLYYPSFNNYKLSNTAIPTSVVLKNVVNSDSLYQRVLATSGAEGEYLHIRKFRIREFIGTNIWDGGWNHSLMFPIIRYADILLMRAEAEYRLGSEPTAKSYLKKITDRAGFASNYTDAFSGQALIDEILKQRQVELLFEGQRVPDMIRLDIFKPPYIGTYPGSVTWDDKLKVLPVPQRELDYNTNLVQNDLWR